MGGLLRVMKKKGQNREISFTKTKQRLQKNAIRPFNALPYKSMYIKVAEQKDLEVTIRASYSTYYNLLLWKA